MLHKTVARIRFYILDVLGGLSIQNTFSEIQEQQYETPGYLAQLQKSKLDKILEIAKNKTKYYNTIQSYSTLEALQKQTVRERFEDFKASSYHKKYYIKATGGSTGNPLVYLTTADSRSYMWAGIMHSWSVAGYELGDKVAFIAGTALIDIKQSLKRKVFYKLFNIHVYSAFSLDEVHIKKYIQEIKERKISIIYGYASAIDKIAEFISGHPSIYFPFLKGIVCTSEVLTPQMRSNIETNFKVKVFNQYGCNEGGVSAFECEFHQMHLITTRCYHDIDKDGHLRATDLTNEGFIMLKYETGDCISMSSTTQCACRRGFPIIEQVIGRKMDMVVDTNNKSLHGSFFYYLFRNDRSIHQYQVSFNKDTINLYLRVDLEINPSNYYNRYLDIIKQHLCFNNYFLELNTGFLVAKNAKHLHVIDLGKTPLKGG